MHQRQQYHPATDAACALIGGAAGLYNLAVWPALQLKLMDAPCAAMLCAAAGAICALMLLREASHEQA